MKKRVFLLMLAVTMLLQVTACSRGNKENSGPSTLVIGTSSFNGIFSPFFYQTAYDAQAFELVFFHYDLYSYSSSFIHFTTNPLYFP